MATTIKDLIENLSQYDADMPVAITWLTGHNGARGVGVYQTMDDMLDNFDVDVKKLGEREHVVFELNTYADDLFDTTDDYGVQMRDMTPTEVQAMFPTQLINASAFTRTETKLSHLQAKLQETTTRLATVEHDVLTAPTDEVLATYHELNRRQAELVDQIFEIKAKL